MCDPCRVTLLRLSQYVPLRGVLGQGAQGVVGVNNFTELAVRVGTSASGYTFRQAVPSRLSGRVFVDTNLDGVYTAGEPLLPGATVAISGVSDLGRTFSLTTATSGTGVWQFMRLRPGAYGVAIAGFSSRYLLGAGVVGAPYKATAAPAGLRDVLVSPCGDGTLYDLPLIAVTEAPTGVPTAGPTSQPTLTPSAQPSRAPSAGPSAEPTRQPSSEPTRTPSALPTAQPSLSPSREPTVCTCVKEAKRRAQHRRTLWQIVGALRLADR